MGVLHNPVEHLAAEVWTAVEQLCKILQPFEQASVELSAEEKVTVSKVIVLTQSASSVHEAESRHSVESRPRSPGRTDFKSQSPIPQHRA